ncbi:hypothetical protein FG386_003198 [Cryptosporidium ryanae]|uniref:uncharacterized protein n=1 Tax=Cryptosporidium ryanae TaxID=515981 RepID=UPI00351A414A|nr:hypothetical protein FG386_003198 [Cryptosporidium ryanae]
MVFDSGNQYLICENCRGDNVFIDPDTGEYYCEECGIQQQDIRRLDRDLDDVYFGSGSVDGRNKIRRATLSNEKVATEQGTKNQNFYIDEYHIQDSHVKNKLYNRNSFEEWIRKKPELIKNSDFLMGMQLILQHTIKDMIERRQVKPEVLHFSKYIWFSFLEFVCNNNIQIRTFFADLRCSILKVPFNETNTNLSNRRNKKCEKLFDGVFSSRENISENIFKDIFLKKMISNRTSYITRICNEMIRQSNKIKRKLYNHNEVEDNDFIIEEWEISVRRLHTIANQKRIPFTNWEGDSSLTRSDTIKCVIDMIYEFDFLLYYFQDSFFKSNSGKNIRNDIEKEYLKWLDLHLYYYQRNKKINIDKNFMINYDSYKFPLEMNFKSELEHQLNKVHITHLLICIILNKDELEAFSSTSLSKYNHIKNFEKYIFDNTFFLDRVSIEDNTCTKSLAETPKIDHCLILCIIWAALMKSGYQVTSNDIIEWVRCGKIDIFKSSNILPKWLKEAGLKWDNDMNSNINTRSVTHLTRVPNINEIEKIMDFFRKNIEVSIPQVSIPILIHRILVRCTCLSYTGGIVIQPLCVRLWELISNETNCLINFNSSTIASSIIVVISRSIWPIFVYHPTPIPKEIKYKLFNSREKSSNKNSALLFKNNKKKLEFFYDTNKNRWEVCFNENFNIIKNHKLFCSNILGIDWSGLLTLNWIKKLLNNEKIDELEFKKILDEIFIPKNENNEEKMGRPSKCYRGNFFSTIRRKRRTARKKTGDKEWSRTPPLYSLINEFTPVIIKKIESLSQYFPSNREIYHSIINTTCDPLNVISSNNSVQSWSKCDDEDKRKLMINWKKILETNKSNDNAEVLQSILENSSTEHQKYLTSFLYKSGLSLTELENIENSKISSILNILFINKSKFLSELFQDPGIFTHIIFGLPQFFHSRQKFNSSEESVPLPYIILLKNLSKITGVSYLLIHSCVNKIEELIFKKLNHT